MSKWQQSMTALGCNLCKLVAANATLRQSHEVALQVGLLYHCSFECPKEFWNFLFILASLLNQQCEFFFKVHDCYWWGWEEMQHKMLMCT